MSLSVRCLLVALLISWSLPAFAQERVAVTWYHTKDLNVK